MKKVNLQKGSVLTISILVLLAAIIAASSAISNLFVSYVTNVRAVGFGEQALLASDAASEDVLFRLKNGGEVGSAESYQVGSSTVNVSVVDSGDTKNITSTATLGGYTRTTTSTFVVENKTGL